MRPPRSAISPIGSGLSSGAIYGTFRGKADLLAAAVDAIIASDVEALPLSVMRKDAARHRRVPVRARAQRERLRRLLLDAAVAARTEPDVREQLRDAMAPHLDMATEAHEEWRDRAGVDPDLDMRALVLLIWSADLGLAVLDAMGVDLPDPKVWSELMHHMLKSLEAPDARPGAPSPRPTPRATRR